MKKLVASRKFRVLLAMTLLVAMLLPTMASAYTAYVNTKSSGLNMREGAGTGYAVVRSFPKGTAVNVLSVANGWAYVVVNGQYGYMSNQYLTTAAPAQAGLPTWTISGVPYVFAEGEFWPTYPNGIPVGSKPSPWGPASGIIYPWEKFDESFYEGAPEWSDWYPCYWY